MFTGLIGDLGQVRALRRDPQGARLAVATNLADRLAEGDSVAVNGVCLTATAVDRDGFQTEAMLETLKRSTLDTLAVGSRVNLELALRPDGRLGGHIVQGHVDGTAKIVDVREEGFSRIVTVAVQEPLPRYLVTKGSVAIDGVSLTVSEVGEGRFSVALIPETLQRTNLGDVRPGTQVNLEVDILAKHVERLLTPPGNPT